MKTQKVKTVLVTIAVILAAGSFSQTPWYLNGNTTGGAKTIGSNDNYDVDVVTNNTSRITLKSNGDVGIGTTSPLLPIHLATTNSWMAMEISSSNLPLINCSGVQISNTQNTTNNWVGVGFADSNIGVLTNYIGSQLTDRTNHYGNLIFAGRDANGFLERMRMTQSGSFGIGTTPAYKLDVLTTSASDGFRIRSTATTGNTEFHLHANNSGGNDWTFFSYGNGASQGAGNFELISSGGAGNLFVDGSNGNVGIGTSSPADKLSVDGNVAPDKDDRFSCGTSANRWKDVWAVNGMIQTSDIRYKTNINDLKYGLQDILKLRPVSYNWKSGDGDTHLGLVAQELKEIINEVVYVGNDANKNLGVVYADLIPVLIKGIQEQQQQIVDQAKSNDNLKNLVTMQQQQINDLQQKAGSATGINQLSSFSDGFNMEQNIPNPFTNETLVKYKLPENTNSAFMIIYDLTGKQIVSLPIDKKDPSLTITSEKLAAGIYIYSIVADGKIIDSKRMVVAGK